jgi:hypothetical protein
MVPYRDIATIINIFRSKSTEARKIVELNAEELALYRSKHPVAVEHITSQTLPTDIRTLAAQQHVREQGAIINGTTGERAIDAPAPAAEVAPTSIPGGPGAGVQRGEVVQFEGMSGAALQAFVGELELVARARELQASLNDPEWEAKVAKEREVRHIVAVAEATKMQAEATKMQAEAAKTLSEVDSSRKRIADDDTLRADIDRYNIQIQDIENTISMKEKAIANAKALNDAEDAGYEETRKKGQRHPKNFINYKCRVVRIESLKADVRECEERIYGLERKKDRKENKIAKRAKFGT